MKKLRLIYNPQAGDQSFRYALDACVRAFQEGGYETHLHRTRTPDDYHAEGMENYDAIVVAGGDGSVNQTVNAMKRCGAVAPLGIIPAGTANDFAAYLKMPSDPGEAARAMMGGRVIKTDLGRVNGQYFVNVCGAGLFTNISQYVDKPMKDSLGKLAYYLKGIEQLPNFVPFPVRVTTPETLLEDHLYLFIALNGCGAGGLSKLSPMARIDDGLLDFIGIKAVSLRELAVLFVNMLKGEFLDDPSVIFLRARSITVENLSDTNDPLHYETDVDGEQGPDMPIQIECVPDAVSLFVPESYR